MMNWLIDQQTAQLAVAYPIHIQGDMPAAQFAGRNFNPQNWNHRVIQPATWPLGPLLSSPAKIIQQFQDRQYLQALAMVVSWGTMWRRSNHIYRQPLPIIRDTIVTCVESIQQTESIQISWQLLTNLLDWSAVITSKTLHFMCRALGFNNDPPVALDNKVILNRVWPAFKQQIPVENRPQSWRGNTFDAYSRYMTAILEWARMRQWTTTDIETTLFDEYR